MDEGTILAYANLVFRGYIPMRDVRWLYGPLYPYVLAAIFEVTGGSLYSERLVGLVYRLLASVALIALVRRRGAIVIVGTVALLTLMLPTQQGLEASASRAALASACVAIALARERRPLAAGAAAGIAVLMRYDWVLPIALCSLPWLATWTWRSRVRAASGFTILAALYVPYIAVGGLGNVGREVNLLRTVESTRRLPISNWPTPAGSLFDLMLFSIALLLVLGFRARRREEGPIFLSVAFLGIGLIPYAISRADLDHVSIGATAPIALLALALPVARAELRPFGHPAVSNLIVASLALGVLLMLLYTLPSRLGPAYAVSHHGRSFLIGNAEQAANAQRAVALADRLAPRNGRLFVGPGDLRRTVYGDSYIYYLLPRLRPATFFIFLDPGVTTSKPHRLAVELRHADVLILNRAYDVVTEDNRSRIYGPSAPNRAVAQDFCRRGRFGSFLVFARCGPRARSAH
jgi:hypothetical protein